MTEFPLKIVTPDGSKYDGAAEALTVRATTGDIGFFAGHINCVAPLGMGRATVVINGQKRYAACIGGMVSVLDGKITLLPTSFEWAEEIDLPRAERSYEKAQNVLGRKDATDADILLAKARLHRALVRKSVAETK
ncbi:MAG: F0F1 ATP synthase subunit epsilon [Ruminococcaceae bacterium]|nr:F0F1 ATP synthase subunit epsilon [Oscillospiraceae bacterium]